MRIMRKAGGAIESNHDGRPWEVITEPIPEEEILVIVTAYPVH